MALIICPECSNKISDRAVSCIHCGFPIKEYQLEQEIKEKQEKTEEDKEKAEKEKFKCRHCGVQNEIGIDYCDNCGIRLTDYKDPRNAFKEKKAKDFSKVPHTVCPKCAHKNESGKFICSKCGYKYKMDDYNVIIPDEYFEGIEEQEEFDGVYRYGLFSGLKVNGK